MGTIHYEWLAAAQTRATYVRPDTCVNGCDSDCDDYGHGHLMSTRVGAVVLSADEVTVIEGTPAQLRALAARILAVVPATDVTC